MAESRTQRGVQGVPPVNIDDNARVGAGPALHPSEAPTGTSIGVGDDNVLLQKFSQILQEQFNKNPQRAELLWKDLDAYLSYRINDLENRLERLYQFREILHKAKSHQG